MCLRNLLKGEGVSHRRATQFMSSDSHTRFGESDRDLAGNQTRPSTAPIHNIISCRNPQISIRSFQNLEKIKNCIPIDLQHERSKTLEHHPNNPPPGGTVTASPFELQLTHATLLYPPLQYPLNILLKEFFVPYSMFLEFKQSTTQQPLL